MLAAVVLFQQLGATFGFQRRLLDYILTEFDRSRSEGLREFDLAEFKFMKGEKHVCKAPFCRRKKFNRR
jgi:hypothetical protein